MDLRQKKTLKAINNAYLELRSKKSVTKITVKELCELAEISKATFYLHYSDIYDLTEKMQKEIIESICSNIEHPDYIFSSPMDFVTELFYALRSNVHMIRIVFSKDYQSALTKAIEVEIKERIFAKKSKLADDVRFNIFITFLVNGSFYTYFENLKKFPEEEIISVSKEMIGNMIKEYR
ncbi:transcriptional regulator, TetR family [Lachnospiraceae bacterium RM5]|nr:transcriptional regulator, TetR family [Lachnospiraceae bacterium RM5]